MNKYFLKKNMLTVLLCSKSPLKREALEKFLDSESSSNFSKSEFNIDTINCDPLGLPSQPVDCGVLCAYERLKYAKSHNSKSYDYYIAIENELLTSTGQDTCTVVIEHRGVASYNHKKIANVRISRKYLDRIYQEPLIEYNDQIKGYSITIGQLIQQDQPGIDPTNWMKFIANQDRVDMIISNLTFTFQKLKKKRETSQFIISKYKTYPDFPKPGVLFYDIFAILADPHATQYLSMLLFERYCLNKVDYVVGLESRGFFGILLAQKLEVGFIPIRKAGKLPGEVEQTEYGTEYSKDKCEIQKNIPPGSRVIIFDDLIATGGSLRAAIYLLEKLNCVVVDCCVLREVTNLREKAKKTLERSYTVILQD